MNMHDYYPRNIKLNGYVPNDMSTQSILTTFFGGFGVIALVAYVASGYSKYRICQCDRLAIVWFALCGCIHTFFEGHFVMKGWNNQLPSDMSLFGQAWKEYAKADSRYMTSDPTVLFIEMITAALEGPASLFLVYSYMYQTPARYLLQLLVSVGQLYGCVVYYVSSWYHNFPEVNPHPQYFWGYFVLCNLPWIIVPIMLTVDSCKKIYAALWESNYRVGSVHEAPVADSVKTVGTPAKSKKKL
ncbi:hypothetical protein MP228_007641 [Amoeboaphelidium protococcarum]|nr:hypothetical protein MP228_007641 [Amoeboaphelidium protococcarum]